MGIKCLWDTNTAIYYLQQQFSKKAEVLVSDKIVEDYRIIIIAATSLVMT